MTLQCRTCAKVIYNNHPTNIFATENFQILSSIQMITGTVLERVAGLPLHICACCLVDVKRAVFHTKTFRERCNRTQEQLLNLLGEKKFKEVDDEIIKGEMRSDVDDSDIEADFLIDSETNDLNSIDECSSDTQDSKEEPISDIDNEVNPNDSEQLNTENKRISSTELGNINEDGRRNSSKVKRYTSWKNLSEEQIVERKRQQRRRDCICDQCGRLFTDQSNFKLHMIRHTGIKNFECQRCSKRFYTDHLLQLHERIVHQGERPYSCKYCDKTFHNSTTRAIHERYHTNIRPYPCEYCEKEFISASSLKRHLLIHNGIRAYFCHICNKNFQRNTHLKAHLKSKLHALKANGNSLSEYDSTNLVQYN